MPQEAERSTSFKPVAIAFRKFTRSSKALRARSGQTGRIPAACQGQKKFLSIDNVPMVTQRSRVSLAARRSLSVIVYLLFLILIISILSTHGTNHAADSDFQEGRSRRVL